MGMLKQTKGQGYGLHQKNESNKLARLLSFSGLVKDAFLK
jgi:hypothetical protein